MLGQKNRELFARLEDRGLYGRSEELRTICQVRRIEVYLLGQKNSGLFARSEE